MENPDKTWSLWGEGTDKPLRTYTNGAEQEMMRQDAALRLEVGTTGQSLESAGFTKQEAERVTQLADKLRTGEAYTTPAEASLGEGIIAESEAAGTLPAWGEVAGAIGTGASTLAWGAGAAYVGVSIGNAIDRVVGLPELDLSKLFGSEAPNPNCGGEHGPFCESRVETDHWIQKERVTEPPKSCLSVIEVYGYTEEYESPPPADKCLLVQGYHVRTIKEEYSGHKIAEDHLEEWRGHFGEDPRFIQQPCYPSEQLRAGFCPTENYNSGHGKAVVNIWDVTRSKVNARECKPPLHGICYPRGGAFEPVFPNTETGSVDGAEGSPGSLMPQAPVTTPMKPSTPTEVNPKVVTYIVTEHPEEFPEAPAETEPEREENEKPVPSPLWPTLPRPEPNELGTDYKNRIESDGFTKVEIQTLPKERTDPRVGPGEVSKVDPKPDNPYDPATKVTVVVNPETAVPGGETGKIPPINIGGVDEPELKPPHLNVLCENFPFGVPCWLVEEFSSWSATGSAPTLGISSFSIKGHTIDAGSINLSSLEPIMIKVRPFMVIFGTIGLVLLFYGFATGGNPGAGSGSSGGGDGSSEEEEG